MIDINPQAPHFSFRLVGSTIIAQMGYDPTGHDPVELKIPEERESFAEKLKESALQGMPRYFHGCIGNSEFGLLEFNTITLPLVEHDGGPIRYLIGLVEYLNTPQDKLLSRLLAQGKRAGRFDDGLSAFRREITGRKV